MGSYLNPGTGAFQMARNSEIFIDKSRLIEETNRHVNTIQRFLCVSRPRRFGKSMAANMLTAYYGKGYDSSYIFDKYEISESKDYKKYQNHYNVIELNIQSFLSLTSGVDEMIALIQEEVLSELMEAYPDIISEKNKILSMALDKI